MKKKIAIFLACFLLIMCPIRGYAVEPVIFGIGEEVILPFLLSLLGVQAKETIVSYQDLKDYNETIKGTLIDSLSGLAGMDVVNNWITKAVTGVIDTDSIIWKKLYEIAINNYVVQSLSGGVSADYAGSLGNYDFTYYENSYLEYLMSNGYTSKYYPKYMTRIKGVNYLFATDIPNSQYLWTSYRSDVGESSNYLNYSSSYTYDNNTVYFSLLRASGTAVTDYPEYSGTLSNSDYSKMAWIMAYGGFVAPDDNISSYSNAFESVLSSSEKDDIIDGSSIIQLYNPDAVQNGLEIIPGGDPDDDPNLKKIPFAVTADWWNFILQFGSGDNSNQYVNAYNALNGLDQGTSIGRISNAWDSLGIASVGAAAANASEGILNLTDTNIYPQSVSVADTITNSIPSSMTPESPDSGIDNESPQGLYKLPDLRDYFPFCIPFDLIDFLGIFVAEPQTPQFVIALNDTNNTYEQSISLERMNDIAAMVRNFELAGFVLALILITRNIIRG